GMEQAGHKCIGYVEFDKFARQSYEAMHDTKGEWTKHDITTVTDDDIRQLRDSRRIDAICGGFPCQAFSIAGKRKGFDDTRGTLFFDIMRFASIIRPSYLFLENVKGLMSHDNGNTFETILRTLDELGYDVEWDLLNSKNFGVPQNRERVFIIGHLREGGTRKVFPVRSDDKKINELSRQQTTTNTLTARYEGVGNGSYVVEGEQYAQKIKVAGKLDIKANDQNKRVYDTEGISPSLTTMQGGGQEPKIAIKENTKKGYVEAIHGDGIRLDHPNGTTGRGRVQKQSSPTLTTGGNVGVITNPLKGKTEYGWHFEQEVYDEKGITRALKAGGGSGNIPKSITSDFRIRKLTPKECFRLQGF